MTPVVVTPQSPAPLTLTVRSPRLGVACRHTEGPATLRGTPDRWRIDFGAAPDISPAVGDELITEAGVQLITEAGVELIIESDVGDLLTEADDSLTTESGDHVTWEEP